MKFQVLDRAEGGLVLRDPSLRPISSYIRQNLDGTLTPTTDASDPLVLVWDPAQGRVVPQRQLIVPFPIAVFTLTNDGDKFSFTYPTYSGAGILKGYVTKSSYGEARQPVDVTPTNRSASGQDNRVLDGRSVVYWHYAVLTDNTEVLIGKQRGIQPNRTWTDLTDTFHIRKGGVYTGNYRLLVSNMNCIELNTEEPVELVNMRIVSMGNGISGFHNNAFVHGCRIWIMNPGGLNNIHGTGINLEQFHVARVEHNYIEDPGCAIQVKTYEGDGVTYAGYVKWNRIRNILGQRTDGNGGYRYGLNHAEDPEPFYRVQSVMFILNKNVPGFEIAWNTTNNEAEYSRGEDNYNTLGSTGQGDGKAILIHDNLVDGAYPWRPADPGQTFINNGYTGGGVLPADGGGAYTYSYSNVIVRTSHYGIGILNGQHNKNNGNRVVSCPYLWDGRRNYAKNEHSAGIFYYSSDPDHTPLISCQVNDNVIGMWGVNDDGTFTHWYGYINVSGDNTATGNIKLPLVTLQDEIAEIAMYRDRVLAAGYKIGA